ncbi:hypothetical protein QWA68_015369 [Fusarium oxysporum]|nr:hypothetical protein QWA68_015369 [Fusarium oxysporum]
MVMARKIYVVPHKIQAVTRLLQQIDHSFNTYSISTSNQQSTNGLLEFFDPTQLNNKPPYSFLTVNEPMGIHYHPFKDLQAMNVTIATIFLTNQTVEAPKSLYDEHMLHWDKGHLTLFDISTPVHGSAHPIPFLASTGWRIPSSGDCRLYTAVCSTAALEELCSLLLSARFGSADVFLDVFGKVSLDSFVNYEHI